MRTTLCKLPPNYSIEDQQILLPILDYSASKFLVAIFIAFSRGYIYIVESAFYEFETIFFNHKDLDLGI